MFVLYIYLNCCIKAMHACCAHCEVGARSKNVCQKARWKMHACRKAMLCTLIKLILQNICSKNYVRT